MCVYVCAYSYMHMHKHACVLYSSLGVRSRMRLAQEVLGERIYISSLVKQVPALTQRPHLGPYIIFDTITSGALLSYHDLKLMVTANLIKPPSWEIRVFWNPGNLNLALNWAPSYAPILDLTTWLIGGKLFLGTLHICMYLLILAQGMSLMYI